MRLARPPRRRRRATRTAGFLLDARTPRVLEAVALALPPLGGLGTEALPAIRARVTVDPPLLAAAVAFATTCRGAAF